MRQGGGRLQVMQIVLQRLLLDRAYCAQCDVVSYPTFGTFGRNFSGHSPLQDVEAIQEEIRPPLQVSRGAMGAQRDWNVQLSPLSWVLTGNGGLAGWYSPHCPSSPYQRMHIEMRHQSMTCFGHSSCSRISSTSRSSSIESCEIGIRISWQGTLAEVGKYYRGRTQ